MKQVYWQFIILGLLLLSHTAWGQEWRVIDQESFRLIYPADVEEEAQRIAARLNTYVDAHLETMPVERGLRKIDVVLRTNEHTSNGFVGVFPYRTVWYNRPAPLRWFRMDGCAGGSRRQAHRTNEPSQ